MKHLILFVIIATLLSVVSAAGTPTGKGSLAFMGTASIQSQSGDLYGGNTMTTLNLSPRALYFLMDQIAVGGRLSFRSSSTSGNSSSSFLIGPEGNYFFEMSSEELLPYAGAGLFVSSSSYDIGGHSESTSGFTIALHGGLAYLLKPHLAILPELELDLENRDSNSGTTFWLGVGLAGFLY